MTEKFKKIVVLDFDGVIHSYTSGWKGIDVIPDEPVEGMREEIARIREEYKVFVVSTRCNELKGIQAICDYLVKHDIQVDSVQLEKPPAFVTVDDRAITFTGESKGLLERINNFKVWTDKSGGRDVTPAKTGAGYTEINSNDIKGV